MRIDSLGTFIRAVFAAGCVVVCAQTAWAQARCLAGDEARAATARVSAGRAASLDANLRDRLLRLMEEQRKPSDAALDKGRFSYGLARRIGAPAGDASAELCRIVKEYGWPASGLVGRDGVEAAFFVLKNGAPFEMQVELLPAVAAAAERGELDRGELAAFIDRVRLRAGGKQLYGTQASVAGGLLVLQPIEDEARVDVRRREYGLPPLAEYLRSLEGSHRMPLVRSPVGAARGRAASRPRASATGEDDDVVRVDTNLVNLHVSVYSEAKRGHVGALAARDFRVFEDGREEEVTFFGTTDVPFDLVLLIDMSGSTAEKRGMIRKTTRRFIEAARPSDRLAIITFSVEATVVAPLTDDRARLLEAAQRIDGEGGSNVWDALKFTLDKVVGPKTTDRRRAVVLMSDGADGALLNLPWAGSRVSFADLVEAVRGTDALIIPVYLDTELDAVPDLFDTANLYENARRTLRLLADESGGLFYTARKVEDLDGVYAQVVNDLGKVYSLGYRPANDRRDGSWRTVRVRLPSRPDLAARARPGYYAN